MPKTIPNTKGNSKQAHKGSKLSTAAARVCADVSAVTQAQWARKTEWAQASSRPEKWRPRPGDRQEHTTAKTGTQVVSCGDVVAIGQFAFESLPYRLEAVNVSVGMVL